MERSKLMSIEETAEYLGIKKSTLYSWVFQRKIPHIKLGRLVKFDPNDVEQLLKQNRIESQC